jgi:protein involved in polysaccharide export with SLBB domain
MTGQKRAKITGSPAVKLKAQFLILKTIMIGRLWKMAGYWMAVLGILVTGLLGGCQTGPKFPEMPPGFGNMFHVGDALTVSGVTLNGELIPPHNERIHEDGTITLSLIGSVTAVGKTTGELQKEIHDLYVPKFYPELTVTVQGDQRYFYVDGDVRSPGGKEYPGEMTIVKAISVAGGMTDFAKGSKVQLTRGGQTQIVNVNKAIRDPRFDVPVYPGDKIFVPRKIL